MPQKDKQTWTIITTKIPLTMENRARFGAVFQSLLGELREELAQRGLPDAHNDRFQKVCPNPVRKLSSMDTNNR